MQSENPIRAAIAAYALSRYGHTPDTPFSGLPGSAVLRHPENRKWYAVFLRVSREKLGLKGEGEAEILNVKTDPVMLGSLLASPGILPAYHMQKGSWVSVLLDGSVPIEQAEFLLNISFSLTAAHRPKEKLRAGPREWLVPANPRYYDVEAAFRETNTILWKQSSAVRPGDTVYLYVASPVSAIRYKCEAVETDIPYRYSDDNVRIKRAMKIKLLHTFKDGELTFAALRSFGVTAVRGPRSVPNRLKAEIARLCGEGG